MDCGLIRKLRGGPDPDMEAAVLDLFPEITVELHRPPLDRPLAFVIAPHRIGHQREHSLFDVGFVRQLLRLCEGGHPGLMAHAGLVVMK
jgi:hypothetical protein